ncbi:MAG: hypothetical protein H7227_04345 [Actinobacteria bacterium]|nr:hypothetical protein [Actinomycetota bacterium]
MSTDPLIGYSHLHATGIRTFNLLISFSEGANETVVGISKLVDLTVIKSNIAGDDLRALTEFREVTLPALISHPHTASAFVIATGDEAIRASDVIGELLAKNSTTEYLMISNGVNQEAAIKIAVSGATDLSTQSLPGLGEIASPSVIVGYENEPVALTDLVAQFQARGISPILRQFSANFDQDLRTWMLEGTHAIVAFTPRDEYPVGTVMTPVINVSSNSDFHAHFQGDFDLASTDPTERIVEELLGLISRVRTFSEYTKTVLPIFPSSRVVADPTKPIGLLVCNEALTSLAEDIRDHFDEVQLLPMTQEGRSLIRSKELVLAITTGAASEIEFISMASTNFQVMNLSERGSLAALAEATAQEISMHK